MASPFGPVEGRRHDSGMLVDSGILQELSFTPDGTPLCVYCDPAYPLRVHLQGPFKGAHLTPAEPQFNKAMSQVRVSVEWLFGDIINYFALLDFKKNLKIGLSPVGKMYIVCALLRNAHSCLYQSSPSKFFGIDPSKSRTISIRFLRSNVFCDYYSFSKGYTAIDLHCGHYNTTGKEEKS